MSATGAATWASNATIQEIAERLRGAGLVGLATHSRPDGDAIGSTLALTRTLHALDIRAVPVYSGPWPKRFDPLIEDTRIVRVGRVDGDAPIGGDPDLLVICDTGSWMQLSELRAWIEPRAERAIIIDHHLHGDPEIATMRHIDTSAAAVVQTVTDLCVELLGVSSARELPAEIAGPLYLGLATDTGWFRHSNISPRVLRLAADLIEAGANHAWLHEMSDQSDSPARVLLMGRALNGLELHADNQVAIVSITREDLKATGGEMDDAGGMNDLIMRVGSVRASAMLTEVEPQLIKVSLRSKPPGGDRGRFVDVSEIARSLGGGGHRQAAGVKLRMDLNEARHTIVSALLDALR